MDDAWELDGGLLAKIDEYFQSIVTAPRSEGTKVSCSLGGQKRGRIIDSPTDDFERNMSDSAESSDSDDDYQPECIVCSEAFVDSTEIGVPMTCLHIFCYSCIKEWSTRTNLCPICKSEFNVLRKLQWRRFMDYITSSHMNMSKAPKKINTRIKSFNKLKKRLLECLTSITSHVETVAHKSLNDEVEENIGGCEVCGVDDHWDQLLLCDGCDLGFHIFCLNPPLPCIPNEDWYCKRCLELQESGTEAIQERASSPTRRRNHRTPSSQGECPRESERSNEEVDIATSGRRQATRIIDTPDESPECYGTNSITDEEDIEGFSHASSNEKSSQAVTPALDRTSVIVIDDDQDALASGERGTAASLYMTPISARSRYYSVGTVISGSTEPHADGNRMQTLYSTTSTSRLENNCAAGRVNNVNNDRASVETFGHTATGKSEDIAGESVLAPTPRQEHVDANRPITVSDSNNSDQIDEFGEERPRRPLSFIYQYRRLMDQVGNSTQRNVQGQVIKGSSLRYIF